MKQGIVISDASRRSIIKAIALKHGTQKKFLLSLRGSLNKVSRSTLSKLINNTGPVEPRLVYKICFELGLDCASILAGSIREIIISKERLLNLLMDDYIDHHTINGCDSITSFSENALKNYDQVKITLDDEMIVLSSSLIINLLYLSYHYLSGGFRDSWISEFYWVYGNRVGTLLYYLVQEVNIEGPDPDELIRKNTKSWMLSSGFLQGRTTDCEEILQTIA